MGRWWARQDSSIPGSQETIIPFKPQQIQSHLGTNAWVLTILCVHSIDRYLVFVFWSLKGKQNFKEHEQINLIFWSCSLCFLLPNHYGLLSALHKGAPRAKGKVMASSGTIPGGHRALDHWVLQQEWQHCEPHIVPLTTLPLQRCLQHQDRRFCKGVPELKSLELFFRNTFQVPKSLGSALCHVLPPPSDIHKAD